MASVLESNTQPTKGEFQVSGMIRFLSHMHVYYVPYIVGVGKERHIRKMVYCETWKGSCSPTLELSWKLLALCQWTLGRERHRYAIEWSDKLGTDPMAVGGICGHYREKWEELREWAPDAVWVWKIIRLTWNGMIEPVSFRGTRFSGTNGNTEKIIPVQLTTSRIGNHTRLIHTLLKVLTMHALSKALSIFPNPPGLRCGYTLAYH